MFPILKVFFIVKGEKSQRDIKFHGGTSNTGYSMTTRKGIFMESNNRGKIPEKGNHGIVHTVKDHNILRKCTSNSTGETKY